MAKNEEEKPKSGCLGKLFGLLVFIVILGLGVTMYFVSQPQDLSDIGGDPTAGDKESAASPPRDLGEVLKKSIEGGYSVVISESEINRMIARELESKQAGASGEWVSIKKVLVRLKEDLAEMIVVRDVQGYEITTSMFLQVDQVESQKGLETQIHLHGGSYHELVPEPTRGGRYGQLTVPQGFLILVMPEFRKIAEIFEAEIDLGFQRMARIKIGNKRLELDPNPPTSGPDADEASF